MDEADVRGRGHGRGRGRPAGRARGRGQGESIVRPFAGDDEVDTKSAQPRKMVKALTVRTQQIHLERHQMVESSLQIGFNSKWEPPQVTIAKKRSKAALFADGKGAWWSTPLRSLR